MSIPRSNSIILPRLAQDFVQELDAITPGGLVSLVRGTPKREHLLKSLRIQGLFGVLQDDITAGTELLCLLYQ